MIGSFQSRTFCRASFAPLSTAILKENAFAATRISEYVVQMGKDSQAIDGGKCAWGAFEILQMLCLDEFVWHDPIILTFKDWPSLTATFRSWPSTLTSASFTSLGFPVVVLIFLSRLQTNHNPGWTTLHCAWDSANKRMVLFQGHVWLKAARHHTSPETVWSAEKLENSLLITHGHILWLIAPW